MVFQLKRKNKGNQNPFCLILWFFARWEERSTSLFISVPSLAWDIWKIKNFQAEKWNVSNLSNLEVSWAF